jgi:hypothetical protein
MSDITDAVVQAALTAWHGSPPLSNWEDKRMRAALEAADKAAWRPIEEARKDGEWLLLFDKRRQLSEASYLIAQWHPALNSWVGRPNSKGRFAIWQDATHFRPLPEGPE